MLGLQGVLGLYQGGDVVDQMLCQYQTGLC